MSFSTDSLFTTAPPGFKTSFTEHYYKTGTIYDTVEIALSLFTTFFILKIALLQASKRRRKARHIC